jgi:hypothetical protein
MVGIKARPRAYPVMRLATVVTAFAFFALVGVDALTGVTLRSAMAPAAEKQLSQEAPAPAAGVLEEGEVILEEEVGEELVTSPEEEVMTFADETDRAKNQVEGTIVPSVEELGAAATPIEEVAEARVPQPTPTMVDEVLTEKEALDDASEEFIQPTEEGGIEPTPALESTTAPSVIREETRSPMIWPPLRIVEVALGGVVLLLAGVTLWMRKTSQ